MPNESSEGNAHQSADEPHSWSSKPAGPTLKQAGHKDTEKVEPVLLSRKEVDTKSETIETACNARDLLALATLATGPGGFFNAGLRRKACKECLCRWSTGVAYGMLMTSRAYRSRHT